MKIAVSAGLTNWSWLVTSMRVLLRSSPIRHLLNTSLATCSHNDRIVTAQAFEMALVGDVLLATIFRQTILVPSKAVCNSTIPDERVRQLRPFDQWGASHVLQHQQQQSITKALLAWVARGNMGTHARQVA